MDIKQDIKKIVNTNIFISRQIKYYFRVVKFNHSKFFKLELADIGQGS